MSLTQSGFGVEIHGVSVEDLDTEQKGLLLHEYHESGGLLLIRGQASLSPKELCEFARIFGDIESNDKYDSAFLVPGLPEVLRIGNAMEDGQHTALFIEADPPPLLWHTDDSFRDPQPIGSCLCCVQAPPEGGETGFAGMAAAYDALTDQLKCEIDHMTAIHSYDHLNELLRIKNPHRPALSKRLKNELPPLRRPLVAIHPVTLKRSLYLPQCHIESVDGLTPAESGALLDRLVSKAIRPEFTYMHKWRSGDLVIWDNRCTLHAPTPFDADRYKRLMYRLTFGGEQIRSILPE